MSGVYTVGGVAPDYATIPAAVAALTSNGVCGPVTISIRDGVYPGQVIIPAISGVSSSNTITFTSESGDSSLVRLQHPHNGDGYNNYVVMLDGASYIRFYRITMERTANSSGSFKRVLEVRNVCSHIAVENCALLGRLATGLGYCYNYSAVVSFPSSNFVSTLDQITDSEFRNNYFLYGANAIYFDETAKNIVIENNVMIDQVCCTIELESAQYVWIRNNYINTYHGPSSDSNVGMYIELYDDTISEITGNNINVYAYVTQVSSTGYGIMLRVENPFVPVYPGGVLVANNSIFMDTPIFDGAGIELWGDDNGTIVANNSVYCHYKAAGIELLNGTTYAYIYNNNVETHAIEAISIPAASLATVESDYNNLYGAVKVATTASTLAAWQLTSGKDQHSVSIPGTFRDTSDLHLRPGTVLYDLGMYLPYLTEDIDGDFRDTINTPGCDHHMELPVDPDLMHITPATFCTGSQTPQVVLHNNGTDTISYLRLAWEVNGVPQPPVVYTGSLVFLDSVTVPLGAVTINSNQSYDFYVQIDSVFPAASRVDAADSLQLNFVANRMSGIYTVAGANPDFASVQAALTALSTRGICGPVVLNIRPGAYDGPFTLYEVEGSSPQNTITIQSEDGDSSSVALRDWFNANGSAVFAIRGACYLMLHNIKVINRSTWSMHPLYIGNGSHHVTLRHCCVYNEEDVAGEAAVATTWSTNYLTIDSCRIGGYDESFLSEDNSTDWYARQHHLVATNNLFFGFDANGGEFVAYKQDSVLIYNNTFEGRGIDVEATHLLCDKNSCRGESNFILEHSKLQNNFFYDELFVGGITDSVYHNTVRSSQQHVFIIDEDAVGIDFQNNIFCNHGGGYVYATTSYSSHLAYSLGKNNDVYTSGTVMCRFANVNYSLTTWRNLTGYETGSIANGANFISATDAHLVAFNPTNISGVPLIPQVMYDIDGDLRDSLHPGFGADAYAPPGNVMDGDAVLIDYQPSVCTGLQPINVVIYNHDPAFSLTSCRINWTVNGVAQPYFTFNGVVPPNDSSVSFTFGSYAFLPSNQYDLEVWTSLPNGFPDNVMANDSAFITIIPLEPAHLGNDTVVCLGNTVVLDPGIYFDTYAWSDGSTDSVITVLETGVYAVDVIDTMGCPSSDSIRVVFPDADLGNDLDLCAGETAVLSVDTAGFTSFLWSTGAVTPQITVNAGGSYWVAASSSVCTDLDTIAVWVHALPYVNLGPDTSICANYTLTLDAGPGLTYSWWDGSTAQTQLVGPGMMGDTLFYWVTVSNQYGCEDTDSVGVTGFVAPLNVTCNGGSFTLTCTGPYFSYNWLGDISGLMGTTQSITTSTAEEITLVVYDASGCMSTNMVDLAAANPAASFTHSTNLFTAMFNNNSGNAIAYLWNFGDNSTSAQANPSHTYATSGVFTVTLIAYGVCTNDTITQTVIISIVGVEEQEGSDVSVFPNPVHDLLVVQTPESSGLQHVVVTDALGQHIYAATYYGSRKEIETTLWAPQTYFIHVSSGGTTAVFKVVVVH